MPISFDIVVVDPEGTLPAYDRIKVFRSTTEAGTFLEITAATTRLVIEPTVFVYRFTDPDGSADHWYRTAYYSSIRQTTAPQSYAFLGEDPILEVLPVPLFKERYLIGLELVLGDGTPFPDSFFEHYIRAGVRRVERMIDLPLRELACEERKDWERRQWEEQYGRLKTNKFPIIGIDEISLRFPGTPANTDALVIKPEWVSLRGGNSRTIQIVPTGGITSFFATGGAWWTLAWSRNEWVPNAFTVKYRAGFQRGRVPEDLVELAGKVASFGPLNVLGDLVGGAGLQAYSISIDGLSRSVTTANSSTNAGFGARIIQYQKEIKEQVRELRDHFHGGDLET